MKELLISVTCYDQKSKWCLADWFEHVNVIEVVWNSSSRVAREDEHHTEITEDKRRGNIYQCCASEIIERCDDAWEPWIKIES